MPRPSSTIGKIASWYATKRFGQSMAPVDATAASPKILIGYGVFETALESAHKMDESLKQLATMKAAAIVGCEWCIDFGSMLHHEKGLPAEQLMALATFRESEHFNDDERLVLEWAEAMSRTPAEPAEDLLERLRARFDEAQIVELTATVAIENYRARFNHAYGFAPQGFAKGAVCAVPERPAAAT